jgi:hypothetical protein
VGGKMARDDAEDDAAMFDRRAKRVQLVIHHFRWLIALGGRQSMTLVAVYLVERPLKAECRTRDEQRHARHAVLVRNQRQIACNALKHVWLVH